MSSSGVIRNASLHDLTQIMNLENRCFSGDLAYSRRQFRYLLTKAHRTFLIETLNGAPRGFIIILYRKGTTVAGLETIDVDPAYQKQGIGLQLLKAAEEEMKRKGITKIRLEVSPGNRAAIALYEKEGFKTLVRLKNYYYYDHKGSRDALRMIKELR